MGLEGAHRLLSAHIGSQCSYCQHVLATHTHKYVTMVQESKEKSKNKNTARSSSSVPAPDAASSKSD